MPKKVYTIDDLYQFCKTNKFYEFNSKDYGAPLIIQSFGDIDASNDSDDILPVVLKSCHVGKNANKSGITKDAMNACKETFKGKPILGAIHKTDTGEYEFHSHDINIVENDDGEQEVEYVEQIIGAISEIDDPYLEYDEKENKEYLMVNGRIFSNYSKAADILERHRTCKCSVEIAVNDMSYNCDEDYLSIDSFEFLGVTILGYEKDGVTEIQEGMKGSKITIDNFSHDKNSMKYENYHEKLVEILEKIDNTLQNFDIKNGEKGGKDMDKFNELLTKYNKTVEDIQFDYEGLTDEELEQKFIDEFDSNDDVIVKDFVKNFQITISHEDIRFALYNLISKYEEEDGDYYFIREVFDDHFLMQGYSQNKLYSVNYEVEDKDVRLVGDRVEMFDIVVTEAEKMEIENMRKNYAQIVSERDSLAEFKDATEKAAIRSKKDTVLNNSKYDSIRNTKAFMSLVNDSDNKSVEDCENCANYIKEEKKDENILTLGVNFADKLEEKDPYNGLFND